MLNSPERARFDVFSDAETEDKNTAIEDITEDTARNTKDIKCPVKISLVI